MTMRMRLTPLDLPQQPKQEVKSISRGGSFRITYSNAAIAGSASHRCPNANAKAPADAHDEFRVQSPRDALNAVHVISIITIAAMSGPSHAHDSLSAALPSHRPKRRRMKSAMPV